MRRLQKQLRFLKQKKRKMIEFELQNIDDLKMKKHQSSASFLNDFLIDVQFKQIFFSTEYEKLLTNFSTETVTEASDSS